MVRIKEIFGELTFSKSVMSEKLSKDVYGKMLKVIDQGATLDQDVAVNVAHAMKEWAIENGATHFTHWFQPQRGGTAEKHDSFLQLDSSGNAIERFSESQLIQSEPDASSFPSGGIRSTFEARGYTAWDPTSPAFLYEAANTRTLVIPSVFLSWTGHVLDIKTAFLRSVAALNKSAIKLQRTLGNRYAKRTTVFCGPEQEYFLFSKDLVETRPDLQVCGRTLFGAEPAKGQQMEDHYFGAIKPKVLNFMEDLDVELLRRGIPAKTRHNEVSPNQFEVAPIYEEANLSIDHNLQLMDIIQNVAERHDLVCALHEKPLDGVNGSGKHLNWSIGDDTGANYLEPSKSPLKNISFLMTVGALMMGVDKFGGLLRAMVADAGNDHRLGANEAPPAIISIYLGGYLNSLLDEIQGIGKLTDSKMADITLGVQNLPRVAKDISDRNRTSPLAFTGNKFEFRGVGSSHNCAESATLMNLMVAYGYDKLNEMLSKRKGKVREEAILVLRDVLKEVRRVQFDGDNYSEDWTKEAEKRGLPNDRNTPAAWERFLEKEAIDLFGKYGVLTEEEMHAKAEIKMEAYNKIKEIELKTALNMARTLYMPAVTSHMDRVASAMVSVKNAGVESKALSAELADAAKLFENIRKGTEALEKEIAACVKETDLFKQAHRYAKQGEDALRQLRQQVDAAEENVADELWPVAKYQEILAAL